ncbi:hypothetical protein F4859DRAFT_514645 [Xylaria cf. heliscus]|nr:hypothetical protein F4859DRAFT_514645 [Xylaria cf. heliscus]
MRYHDALKDSVRSPCVFVAIDFKGLVTKEDEPIGITDIGIGVLTYPPATPVLEALCPTCQTLRSFFEQNTIECSWFQIKGKQKPGPRNTCHFGQFREIQSSQTEDALVDLLKSIRDRFSSPLVLVGFDLVLELTTIASHLNRILPFFSSWVDLREIVKEKCKTRSPGLRDTLRALGFPEGDLATSGPKEIYPYTAKIRVQGKDLTSSVLHWPQLIDIFSRYNPVAVGIKSNGKYGWISLPSLVELNRFVEEVHGKEIKGEIWDVFSNYDPLITPMTHDQLRAARQASQEAQQETIQLERRMKKEAVSDQLESIDWPLELMELLFR